MKHLFFAAILVVSTTLLSFKIVITPLKIGSLLPDPQHKMKDVSGKEVSFNEAMKPNGLLVMFSCNTCPFVIKHQQKTKEVAAYALKNNIGVILLNANEGQRDDNDSFDEMKNYAKDQGYNWYYAVDKDSKMADAFGASMTPESFLFNKDGKLVYHGAINDRPRDPNNGQKEYLKNAMNEMLNGKEVSVTTYPQLGCGIKRKN
ncbi:MAG: thioredoxin family protein [Sphingobacteriales bacterium]|nr:MAG: thioredoxin family protein [Sphingobacteriales bacterium]